MRLIRGEWGAGCRVVKWGGGIIESREYDPLRSLITLITLETVTHHTWMLLSMEMNCSVERLASFASCRTFVTTTCQGVCVAVIGPT